MSTYEVPASIHVKPYVQTKEEYHLAKVKRSIKKHSAIFTLLYWDVCCTEKRLGFSTNDF